MRGNKPAITSEIYSISSSNNLDCGPSIIVTYPPLTTNRPENTTNYTKKTMTITVARSHRLLMVHSSPVCGWENTNTSWLRLPWKRVTLSPGSFSFSAIILQHFYSRSRISGYLYITVLPTTDKDVLALFSTFVWISVDDDQVKMK